LRRKAASMATGVNVLILTGVAPSASGADESGQGKINLCVI